LKGDEGPLAEGAKLFEVGQCLSKWVDFGCFSWARRKVPELIWKFSGVESRGGVEPSSAKLGHVNLLVPRRVGLRDKWGEICGQPDFWSPPFWLIASASVSRTHTHGRHPSAKSATELTLRQDLANKRPDLTWAWTSVTHKDQRWTPLSRLGGQLEKTANGDGCMYCQAETVGPLDRRMGRTNGPTPVVGDERGVAE